MVTANVGLERFEQVNVQPARVGETLLPPCRQFPLIVMCAELSGYAPGLVEYCGNFCGYLPVRTESGAQEEQPLTMCTRVRKALENQLELVMDPASEPEETAPILARWKKLVADNLPEEKRKSAVISDAQAIFYTETLLAKLKDTAAGDGKNPILDDMMPGRNCPQRPKAL